MRKQEVKEMKEQTFQEISLQEIARCPWQPRKRFDGPEFDDLVNSVREKGVLEPVLIRPIPEGPKLVGDKDFPTYANLATYELVAGERRFRAACTVANENGGLEGGKIPAMVRDMTDDDAFDVMCIENLHRKDLEPLEEAENFKAFLTRHGEDSLKELSDRTGINPRYIRRRVAVLDLPKKCLKAWSKGDLKYGHLEQLSRLRDKKDILAFVENILRWRGAMSVRDLKEHIDERAVDLKAAKFDKAECKKCYQNSAVQKNLIDIDGLKGTQCLNPKCYKQRLNDHLQANWKKTGYYKQHGTTGFRFHDDLEWRDYENFYTRIRKDCKACPHFVTLISTTGDVRSKQVCIGDKDCYTKMTTPKKKKAAGASGKKDGPRVAWHGEHFRERFFKEQIPMKLKAIPPDDEKSLRLALFSLLKSNHDLYTWFNREYRNLQTEDDWEMGYLTTEDLFQTLLPMDEDQILQAIKAASLEVILQQHQGPDARRFVADHIGIDLTAEWRITQEYLDKKTKAEIFAIADEFKIFEDKKAKAFLYEKLLKKRGSFKSCKKPELVRIFLESGVDLAGVVPKEIRNIDTDD